MASIENGTPVNFTSPDERDLRLDFFRGLALLSIFVNHIPDNTATWLTWRPYGFSDAAEAFVFLSGFSAALGWSRLISNRQSEGWKIPIRRTVRVYCAFVGLSLLTVFLAWGAWKLTGDSYWPNFYRVSALLHKPASVLPALFTLRYLPAYADILPMYVVFLLLLAVSGRAMEKHPGRFIVASVLFWFAAPQLGWNLPAGEGHSWYFNPFCWQLLFVLGYLLGRRQVRGQALVHDKRLIAVALSLIAFAFVVKSPWQVIGLPPLAISSHWMLLEKTEAGFGRLVHFGALAFVIANIVPRGALWLHSSWARPFVDCGRNSLWVFVAGAPLSACVHFICRQLFGSAAAYLLFSTIGATVLLLTGRLCRTIQVRYWPRRIALPDVPAGINSASMP